MYKRKKWGWYVLAMIVFVAGAGLAVMLLWNWLIPEIFNGPTVSYLQALGLLLLSKILVGFGSTGKKYHYQKKYSSGELSYKDKDLLKRKFMEKCGWGDEKSTPSTSEEESNSETDK